MSSASPGPPEPTTALGAELARTGFLGLQMACSGLAGADQVTAHDLGGLLPLCTEHRGTSSLAWCTAQNRAPGLR